MNLVRALRTRIEERPVAMTRVAVEVRNLVVR
jgi:hypothetical protein